jgi:Family of unknown function (DUF6152)
MNIRTILLAGLAASLIAAPTVAHHSFAMFDATKVVTLDGTVKSFEWTNPHMWLTVTVPQANGQAIEYPLEMQGIAGAVKLGWKRDTARPGDKISVNIHPLRDGTHGGQLLSVVLASGAKLGVMGQAPAQ